ncbi:MAG: PilN domain-containing protein [Rhodoblastus sp.]|nr:MAG: PilN domain-containing protein [Rhodoblastus sp.]
MKISSPFAAARFTDVWAELTKHLPDDCWVNELRVTSGANGEQLISISGFADSPAQLVRLLEEVGTFSNTLLGAAVTFDPVERKQRFSLQTVFHRRGNP